MGVVVGPRFYVDQSSTLWDGLVAYYTADNTPNDALGSYNGTLVNGATYGTGIINQGFSLDGVNDYVDMGDVLDFDGSTPFSLNLWFNHLSSKQQCLISKEGTGPSFVGYVVQLESNNRITFYLGSNFGTNNYLAVTTVNTFSPSVLRMLTLTYDGSKDTSGITISIDGVVQPFTVGRNTLTGSTANSFEMNIASAVQGTSRFFDGVIDEIGVFNRVLTSTEATELYNSGAGKQYPTGILPLWNGLVAYYTADNTPNDALGNYNGTLTNGATYGTGKINNGFAFDGVNDYVNLGDNLDIRLSSWTYNFWINMDTINRYNTILTKSDAGSNWERWWFIVDNNNKLEFHLQNPLAANNATTRKYFRSTQSLNASTWYMVTMVLDRTDKAYMYINGVPETIISTDGNGTVITNELSSWSAFDFNRYFNCCVGSFSYGLYPFDGIIDEGAIWNTVKTSTEITELYNSGVGKQYLP